MKVILNDLTAILSHTVTLFILFVMVIGFCTSMLYELLRLAIEGICNRFIKRKINLITKNSRYTTTKRLYK